MHQEPWTTEWEPDRHLRHAQTIPTLPFSDLTVVFWGNFRFFPKQLETLYSCGLGVLSWAPPLYSENPAKHLV